MKLSRLFFLFTVSLLAVGAFSGCSDDSEPSPVYPSGVCPRTVVMYVVADNSLRPQLVANVEQAIEAAGKGLPQQARLLVYMDTWHYDADYGRVDSTVLLDIVPGGGRSEARVLKRYEPQNSLDPSVMKAVLADMVSLAPNESYGIVLSSHATGWFPPQAGNIARPRSSDGPFAGHDWRKAPGAEPTRTFGDDGGANVSISDLAEGLSGVHFDFLLFDACFMSSVEALYDLRGSADYIVASPAEVMGAGFPYLKAVPMFFEPEAALERVCRAFVDTYRAEPTYKSASVALVDCRALDALAESVRAIMRGTVNEVDPDSVQALEGMGLNNFGGPNIHAFFDLEDYMVQLCPDDALKARFGAALRSAVIFEDHTERIYSGYSGGFFDADRMCGISTYIPRDEFPVYKALWEQTEWARYVTR